MSDTEHKKPGYYGQSEVLNVTATEGEGHVCVMFKTGEDKSDTVLLSPRLLREVITAEPVDASKLRELRVNPVAEEVLGLILKHNLKVGELEFLFSTITRNLNQAIETANAKRWGVEHYEDRTILEIDRTLKPKE